MANAAVGDPVTFTLLATHAGGADADGAVVRDPAVAGLDCSAAVPTCSATAGAVCPASPTMSALQGAGLVIPTWPAGGTIEIGFTCEATGTP